MAARLHDLSGIVVPGRETRYTYLAVMEVRGRETVFIGVDKVDLQCQDPQAAVVGSIVYGHDIVGGEAAFVPSRPNPDDCNGERISFVLLVLCLADLILQMCCVSAECACRRHA